MYVCVLRLHCKRDGGGYSSDSTDYLRSWRLFHVYDELTGLIQRTLEPDILLYLSCSLLALPQRVLIMPAPPPHVSPYLIITFRLFQDLHIYIYHTHPLLGTQFP